LLFGNGLSVYAKTLVYQSCKYLGPLVVNAVRFGYHHQVFRFFYGIVQGKVKTALAVSGT
jgi:hypothetical protein